MSHSCDWWLSLTRICSRPMLHECSDLSVLSRTLLLSVCLCHVGLDVLFVFGVPRRYFVSYSALKASLLSFLFSPFLFVQSRYGDWFHPIPIHLEELLFFSD